MKSHTLFSSIIIILVLGCSSINYEDYYLLSEERIDEIVIDYTLINGDYSTTYRKILIKRPLIQKFVEAFKKTETNEVTRITTRGTTSQAKVTIRYDNNQFLHFDVGLIDEQPGYIQFVKRRSGFFRVYGEKYATEFVTYLFSLLETD